MASPEKKIVIIGAGPTGLGAAYRLKELGYTNFVVYERSPYVGGLASSFTDPAGFTWDIGGHVMFSHYKYYDDVFDRVMGSDYQMNDRECWVRMFDTWVPYPFQNNIRYLPKQVTYECLTGLIEAQTKRDHKAARNFDEFIDAVFGDGIAKHFMKPYNFKVWAHPPRLMNKEWIGERVAMVDIQRVLGNVVLDRDDAGWGPNSTFKYPLHGGTGGLFERMRPYVEQNLRLDAPVAGVDIERKEVVLQDGSREPYDILLNTTPLDLLVRYMKGDVPEEARCQASRLRHSGSYIVGVGVNQPSPSRKCWMYFPESSSPFYRVTYLSNYSPEVVPDASRNYSLLAEISHSEFKPVDRESVVEDTIQGMINTRLLSEEDRADIIDTHVIERDYTYPTPSLERDEALRTLHPWLETHDIYSRGRFGAWRYEVGNMDHSVAQGVEWVNRIVQDDRANELTYLAKRGC